MADAVIGFLLAIVASSTAAAVWLSAAGTTELSNLGALAAQLGLWGGLLGAPLVASYRRGRRDLAADFGLRAERRDGWAVAIGAICQLVAFPLLYLALQAVFGDLDVGRPARELADRASGWEYLVLALLVSFAAPVIEELFYRGLVLRAVARRRGPRLAVLVSSAWFGASHLQVIQFPALFLLGVVLATLTVRTGRLGPAIAAHVAFNSITMVLLGISS